MTLFLHGTYSGLISDRTPQYTHGRRCARENHLIHSRSITIADSANVAQRAYHSNITLLAPDVDSTVFIEANTTAVDKNNAANLASEARRYGEAISLHKEALELKLRAFGEESVQAAMSFNGLGEVYLKVSKLNEAEEVFAKALKVRDNAEFGGLELGPRNDAAATRDNIAQLREAQGRFEDAREMRLKGANKGETMCGNSNVRIFTLA